MCGSHLKVVLQVDIRHICLEISYQTRTQSTHVNHTNIKSVEMVLMHHTDFLFLFFSVLHLK